MPLNRKQLPYIFLLILIIILIFFSGVKYGSKVEETNTVIKFILSLTPTRQPTIIPTIITPTETKIGYFEFEAKLCGVNFLLPNNLKSKPQPGIPIGTYEFVNNNNGTQFRIWCAPLNSQIAMFDLPPEPLDTSPNATLSAVINKQKISATRLKNDYNIVTFSLKHPKVRSVGVLIDKSLLPLFQKSIEFTDPTDASTQSGNIVTY